MTKDERNLEIFKMYNSGKTEREIADKFGLGKTTVHNILNGFLGKKEDKTITPVMSVEIKGNEERFESFVGWIRTNVNEYSHKDTGEVIRVAFVKAKEPGEFGYFVKLGNSEKKFDPADDVIKEAE